MIKTVEVSDLTEQLLKEKITGSLYFEKVRRHCQAAFYTECLVLYISVFRFYVNYEDNLKHEDTYLKCINRTAFSLYSSVKTRPVRMPPGYQAELVIQLVWVDGEPPQQVTSLAVSSAYGM